MTSRYAASSRLILSSSCSGDDGMVDTPPAAKRVLTSGRLRISTTLADSLSMIALGVALGATRAVQFDILISPAPCCASGGHCGLTHESSPVVMPRIRILPLETYGDGVDVEMIANGV